jgi:putative MATE family efflux protein
VRASENLTEGSIRRHLLRLSLPMLLGISSMIIAMMIDTIYIGWVGTAELAAVSFTFPVVMALSSLAMGVGVGASSIMARTLGAGDRGGTLLLGAHTLVLVTALVLVVVALGWWISPWLFASLGADDVILPLVVAYMAIWFIGLPLFALPMVATSMLRALGDARISGILMTGSSLLQVVIAPVLIFGIGDWSGIGFLGSAWGFVTSRLIVFIAAVFVMARWGFLRPLGPLRGMLNAWREVLRIGLPVMLNNLIGPVTMGVIFALLAGHGHEIVAGFGIAVRIEMLALVVLMALSSSIAPVVGQNFGAGRHSRIRRALSFGYRFSLSWGVFAFALLALAGRPIALFINDNPVVVDATYQYLLIVSLSYGFAGMMMVAGSGFVALGKPMPSLLLSIGRMLVIYIPLAVLGDRLLGYQGIFAAGAISNLAIGVAAYYWIRVLVPWR